MPGVAMQFVALAAIQPGDAWRGNGSDGTPTFSGGETHGRRPVVLNRAFRAVGELGYAFRDLPFKSLDFWSPDSADAALLDVFCLEEERRHWLHVAIDRYTGKVMGQQLEPVYE